MNKTPLFALAAFAVAGLLFVYGNQGTQVETNIDLTNAVETTADMGTTALTVGEDILLEDIAPAAGDEEGIAADEDMGEEESMPVEDMDTDTDTDADAEDDSEGDMTEGDEGSDAEDMPMEEEEGESVH